MEQTLLKGNTVAVPPELAKRVTDLHFALCTQVEHHDANFRYDGKFAIAVALFNPNDFHAYGVVRLIASCHTLASELARHLDRVINTSQRKHPILPETPHDKPRVNAMWNLNSSVVAIARLMGEVAEIASAAMSIQLSLCGEVRS